MRALFIEFSSQLSDGRYVFVAKESINTSTYNDLKSDFLKILRRTGGMAGDTKNPS
jgi:ribonuclease P protein component